MMYKLWMVCSLVGLTVAGEGSPLPISEEAVVKSDRVGNNFAYSIRHEQRSVIPAGAGSVSATPLSSHPVIVPNAYPSSGVATSGSSSSSSAASGGAVHQFKSATASSSAVSGSATQQHQQQQQQQQQQQLQQLHHRQHDEQQQHHQQHHQQQHDQQSTSGIASVPGVSSVSVVSSVPSVSSNAVVQTPPGAVAAPVIYQQLTLPLRTQMVSQPAGVEVLQAAPAAAVGVYPPAAVGVFHYPSPTGAALVGSTSSELVHDSTKLVHQPPTFFVAQVAPSPVYGSPEPVAHPAYYTPAVYPAEVARPEALKFVDGSTLKLADGSTLKWADASALKWTDAPAAAVKWTEIPAQKWAEASALKWADNSAHEFADAAVLKFDTSSPLRFAEPAAVRFGDSVKYAADASGSRYALSDSSATKFSSGSAISDNKVAADSSAKASEVATILGAHVVKSESEKQESASSESQSQSAKLYSAPAIFATAPYQTPYQQAFYADSVPRQFYSGGVVSEPTFYAATARIAHQPIYSPVPVPVPVQQAIVPNFELHALHDKAQVRGFSLPTRQVHYATARQPAFVTGVHQASGLSSSHEAHSQSSSAKIY